MHSLERRTPDRLGSRDLAFKAEPVDRSDELLEIVPRTPRARHQVIGRLGAERQAALRAEIAELKSERSPARKSGSKA